GKRGQTHPDLALEAGALWRQRKLEAAPSPAEIFVELRARLAQQRDVAFAPVSNATHGMAVVAQLDGAQAVRIGSDAQRADRAVDEGGLDVHAAFLTAVVLSAAVAACASAASRQAWITA